MTAAFDRHLAEAAQIVAGWPSWKRNVLGWYHSETKAKIMTPEQWRNSGRDEPVSFSIVELADCPPIPQKRAWCEWLRHIDGREVLLLRGNICTAVGTGYWYDYLAQMAFGPDSCHACVTKWADGAIENGEYKPHYITSDKTPKLVDSGRPCVHCRARLAKQHLEQAAKYVCERFGIGATWTVPEQWAHRFASVNSVTYPT